MRNKMDWIKDYQLFLFDFDGLLVDTEKMHYASYVEMCRRHGWELNWDFQRFCFEAHGKAMGIWEALGKEFPRIYAQDPKEVLYEEKKRIYVELLQSARLELMEGVAPLLTALAEAGIGRAVVTNSPRAHIEIIKQSLPMLRTIPVWVTREDYLNPKPAPDGYLKAIEMLAKPNDRIIGFEDTLKGLKALIAAGAEGVLVCPADHEHVKEGTSLGARHFEKLSLISYIELR
jgi:HAD superfamily hydrolase (TIGR01509 family)